MRTSTAMAISAAAAAFFVQLCPAPPVVIAAAITASGAIIGGGISTAGKVKRDDLYQRQDRPPGVPQQDYDRCVEELKTANVVVTGPVSNNGIQADGVPPTCMTLATVLVGDPVNGPYPTPLGSASLLYDNLTPEQYNDLAGIFTAHQ